jgi:hypothetical protein
MAALGQVVPLFRAQAFSHIEIIMLVWPQRDSAMWRVILEQQAVSGDLHRAAAEISTAYGGRLRTAISSAAEDVHVSIVDADTVPAIRKAIVDFKAGLVFCVLGGVEPDSQIAENMREIVRESTVPLWVLHAPVRTVTEA